MIFLEMQINKISASTVLKNDIAQSRINTGFFEREKIRTHERTHKSIF